MVKGGDNDSHGGLTDHAGTANVLLITCDQLRGDSLGCYGHPIVETPYLDHLGAEGIRFTQAYAATPSCIAARASILTGMIPRRHGRVGYKDGSPSIMRILCPANWPAPATIPKGSARCIFTRPETFAGFIMSCCTTVTAL